MNSIAQGWNYRSKELLKAIFSHQNSNKKADRNFLQPPIPVCRGAYISYFKIDALILFWRISQLSGHDQQNGNWTYCRLPP